MTVVSKMVPGQIFTTLITIPCQLLTHLIPTTDNSTVKERVREDLFHTQHQSPHTEAVNSLHMSLVSFTCNYCKKGCNAVPTESIPVNLTMKLMDEFM